MTYIRNGRPVHLRPWHHRLGQLLEAFIVRGDNWYMLRACWLTPPGFSYIPPPAELNWQRYLDRERSIAAGSK